MKYLIAILWPCLLGNSVLAQNAKFDPVDWTPDQPVTVRFDMAGTPFSGFSGNLYLWSWYANGAAETVNSPNNGSWASSSAASQLTNNGGNIWSITFTPTTYFGVAKEILNAGGVSFLVKTLTGVAPQSPDFKNIKPLANNGISPNTNWTAAKKITITVDLNGSALAGNAGPLYYWGWYNTGTGDVTAPGNGSWGASASGSQMTQVASNVWSIDITPTTYFGTTAANITPSTVFGLVKTQNGSAQSANFGKAPNYAKYQITQTNAGNVIITPALPALPADNVPVTFRFTASTELVGHTGSVFMHTGVVTSGMSSNDWSYTKGTWGSSTSDGQMTQISTGVYELTIPSIRAYYGLPTGVNAYKIRAVFRNASGSIVEKDGSEDYTFPIQAPPYLELREPVGSFITKPINQPFRITGYTSQNCNYTITVNGTTVHTVSSTQRATVLYTPTTAGTYNIVITAVNGGTTFTKTTAVVVCSGTSISQTATLPAGMKNGVNYHPSDPTKATLVLPAPTESKKSVHIIGDFNNWTVNCNFLMGYDPAKKVFWKELTGLTSGQEYVFQYLIDGETRIADPYAEKISDPWNDASIPSITYPGLIAYPTAAMPQNGETPTIASTLRTNQPSYIWQVTNFVRPAHNKLNVYQLHFRDFTTEGTFNAAVAKLDYLKRLGINAIETLPVSEFEGNDSWGYNPNFFFAVDKAYGTKNEYKNFVDECHKRGIAVLGDIVLNHAFGTNPMARMYWDTYNNRPATNNPWFNAMSNFSNPAAQWGNDFNHSSPHTRAFTDSVIHFWMTEYKIDGIRFDFTKGFSNTPYPNASCGDQWGGCYDASRVAYLKSMRDKMAVINNGATGAGPITIFEHLATLAEDKELADYGILLWGGHGVTKKYEEVAMGWPPTSADPFKSDVGEAYYKQKTFNFANWISYMESHDEQRMGYQQTQFGNGTVQSNLATRSQFLQVTAAVNLLFPGGRMVWQFGELGYDIDINFNGRTGRKPVLWNYYDVPERRKIYETYSRLFFLRNHLPATFHRDFDNSGGDKTDLVNQFKRYHFYNAVGDTAVTVIANTGNSVLSGDPKFNATATQWYEFMTGQMHSPSSSMSLQPGEFRVYFNKVPIQAAPVVSLTSSTGTNVGSPTTNITFKFDKPIWKKLAGSMLGEAFTGTNILTTIELRNAANSLITCTGSISADGQTLTLDPSANLPAGNYTASLLANAAQNYGGLVAPVITYNFSVAGGCPVPSAMQSVNNGLWNDPNTWSCGRVPTKDDDVLINGHTVTASGLCYAKNVAYATGGIVTFTTGGELRLNVL